MVVDVITYHTSILHWDQIMTIFHLIEMFGFWIEIKDHETQNWC